MSEVIPTRDTRGSIVIALFAIQKTSKFKFEHELTEITGDMKGMASAAGRVGGIKTAGHFLSAEKRQGTAALQNASRGDSAAHIPRIPR